MLEVFRILARIVHDDSVFRAGANGLDAPEPWDDWVFVQDEITAVGWLGTQTS